MEVVKKLLADSETAILSTEERAALLKEVADRLVDIKVHHSFASHF